MTNPNGDKGKAFERALCAYLRPWWPGVERTVRTGYRIAERTSADHGDLHIGVPGLHVVVQAKDVAKSHPRGLANKALDDLVRVTRAQRDAAGAVLGLLVEKRPGHASPAEAWCHLGAAELYALIDGWQYLRDAHDLVSSEMTPVDDRGRLVDPLFPVRARFGDVVDLLRAGGFAPEPVPVTEG